jgi:hypothetical protein
MYFWVCSLCQKVRFWESSSCWIKEWAKIVKANQASWALAHSYEANPVTWPLDQSAWFFHRKHGFICKIKTQTQMVLQNHIRLFQYHIPVNIS